MLVYIALKKLILYQSTMSRESMRCRIPRPIRPWGRPVRVKEPLPPLPEFLLPETSVREEEDGGWVERAHEFHYWFVWLVGWLLRVFDLDSLLGEVLGDLTDGMFN